MIRRNARTVVSATARKTTSFDLLGGDYAAFCYGYEQTEERLIPAPAAGEAVISLGGVPVAAKHAASDGKVLYILEGGVCCAVDIADGAQTNYGSLSVGDGFIVDSLDEDNRLCYCFIGGGVCLRVYAGETSGSATSASLGVRLYRGVMHCHRLFAIDYDDRLKIRWTGYDTLDFTEDIAHSGYLELFEEGGNALSVYEYGDDVLVLREGGITVIHALGDPRNYRIASAQKLVPAKGVVCGGGEVNGLFWFCCEDGIYSFDGTDIERKYVYSFGGTFKYVNLTPGGSGSLYAETSLDGTSYLLLYRPTEESFSLFCKDCAKPVLLAGELSCAKDSSLYFPAESYADGERVWRSAKLLNGGRQSFVKSIKADCDDGVVITAYCDGEPSVCTGAGEHLIKKRALELYIEISGEGETRSLKVETEASE